MQKNKSLLIAMLFFCLNTNAISSTCDDIDNEQELFNCEKNNLHTYTQQLNNSVNSMINKLNSQRDHYVANRANYFNESQIAWEQTTDAFCKYTASAETGNMKEIKSFLCIVKAMKARIKSVNTDIKNLKNYK